MDKSKTLRSKVELINQKVKFRGNVGGNPDIIIDYIQPIGDGEGYTSLELFLISLSTCAGTSVLALLRKMNKDVNALTIHSEGIRRVQHPTGFEKITMEFILKSNNIILEDVAKAIKISEDSLCPVWSMIKGNVEVSTVIKIES